MFNSKNILKTIFIISVAAVFILLTVLLSNISINVYETVKQNDARQEISDVMEYFSKTISRCDGNNIRTDLLDNGSSALVIQDHKNGKILETWIFTDKGKLKKAVVESEIPVSVKDAEKIMKLENISFMLTDTNLLEVRYTTSDQVIRYSNFYVHNY